MTALSEGTKVVKLSAFAAMAFFVALSNYLLLFPINDWLTWGAFTYPMTFLVTELANWSWGPATARQVAYMGFLWATPLSFMLAVPRIAIASVIAFLVSQLLDISLFSKLRQLSWWQAPLISSVTASAVDTALFFSLAFAFEDLPWRQWAFGDFCIKCLIDLIMLLPFRLTMLRWAS